jgi:hypothetical protein
MSLDPDWEMSERELSKEITIALVTTERKTMRRRD